MKIISAAFATTLAVTSVTASNPFAPKTTRNTRRANYVGSLMKNARPTPNSKLRHLEEEQEIDISSYSIKFEKCQYIKQFAEERNEDIDTVLERKGFVIFRLCPDSSCSNCNYNYGEYIVDMATYLESTLQHKEEEQEQYCEACEECGNDDQAEQAANDDANGRRKLATNVNCNTCYNQCQNIENMEENGYVDAAEYINCEKVYENENSGVVYYAGAICANYGSRIKVGLFTDEECSEYDNSVQIDNYLKNNDGYNIKLSYHLLKQTFAADECIASCAKVDENAEAADDDANAEQQEVETAEVCKNLYEAAGKCENPHGFSNGMDYSNSDYYDIQAANEESVCGFLDSIKSGNYDETGEIVIRGGQTTVFSNSVQTTGGQKFALTFFVIGTVGLASYAVMLHHKLTKSQKPDLAAQGADAMLA